MKKRITPVSKTFCTRLNQSNTLDFLKASLEAYTRDWRLAGGLIWILVWNPLDCVLNFFSKHKYLRGTALSEISPCWHTKAYRENNPSSLFILWIMICSKSMDDDKTWCELFVKQQTWKLTICNVSFSFLSISFVICFIKIRFRRRNGYKKLFDIRILESLRNICIYYRVFFNLGTRANSFSRLFW